MSARFGLHHEESSAFAQVETGPIGIERTTRCLVENHQRAEAIEVEARQTFAAADHNTFESAATQQVGAHQNAVGSRRTSRAARRNQAPIAEIGGHILRSLSTVSDGRFVLTGNVTKFCQIHTSDRRAGDQSRSC